MDYDQPRTPSDGYIIAQRKFFNYFAVKILQLQLAVYEVRFWKKGDMLRLSYNAKAADF